MTLGEGAEEFDFPPLPVPFQERGGDVFISLTQFRNSSFFWRFEICVLCFVFCVVFCFVFCFFVLCLLFGVFSVLCFVLFLQFCSNCEKTTWRREPRPENVFSLASP